MIRHFLFDKKLKTFVKLSTLKDLNLNENLILLSLGTDDLSKFFDENALNASDKARFNEFKGLQNNQSFINSRALMIKIDGSVKSSFSSLSHKKELVIIARANFKIGADIEILKPRKIKPALDFAFNAYERTLIERANEPLKCFYEIFTLKEALLKFANLGFESIDKVGLCKNLNTNLNICKNLSLNLSSNSLLLSSNAHYKERNDEKIYCKFFTHYLAIKKQKLIFSLVHE